jgi:hypothetical protein
MIEQHVIEDIKKYSFVTDAYRKGAYLHIVFDDHNGEDRTRKIFILSNKRKLQQLIKQIKTFTGGKQSGKKENTNRFYVEYIA